MKPRYKLLVAVPLASAMMFAQSLTTETSGQSEGSSYTYTGNIVNASCYQAAGIMNRNSRGYAPPGAASAFTAGIHKPVPNATPRKKKEILRHCSINPGTTAFALLNDEGNFFKLDDKGNLEVMSQVTGGEAHARSGPRKIKVSVTGSVDRDTLVVRTVSKM
jgi:hypothetical protein